MATAAHTLISLDNLSRPVRQWVNSVRELTQPRAVHWVRGERRGSARDHRAAAEKRRTQAPQCRIPRLSPVPLVPERCGARRASHLYLYAFGRGCRAEQSLDGAAGRTRQDARAVSRLHARAHPVRHSLLHGTARLAAVALRRRDHRQSLRRPQHADHDARRPRGARAHRPRGQFRPRPALHRRARSAAPLHHALPGGTARSRATVPATVAMRCLARNAMRCASPAGRRAARAGWPSTC